MLTCGGVVSPLPRAAQLKRTARSNMKQKNKRTRAGSEAQYGPRLAGEILHRNTHLCVDLKTFLLHDRIVKMGKSYPGVLTRDTEDHYTFIETLTATEKRNPRVFDGTYLTITRWSDGSLHPNFKPMRVGEDFSVDGYAIGVCNELRRALIGLVEED